MSTKLYIDVLTKNQESQLIQEMRDLPGSGDALGKGCDFLFPQVQTARAFAHAHANELSFDDSVYSLNRWFEKLWELKGSDRALINPLQRKHYLRSSIIELEGGVKATPGKSTSSVLARNYLFMPGIQELIESVIKKCGTKLLESDLQRILAMRMGEDILNLVDQYFKFLDEEGLIEEADAYEYISQSDLKLERPLCLISFSNLSLHQLKLFIKLEESNSVNYVFDYHEDDILCWAKRQLISYVQNKTNAELESFISVEKGELSQFARWKHDAFSQISIKQKSVLTNDVIVQGKLGISLAMGDQAEISAIVNAAQKFLEEFAPSDIAIAYKGSGFQVSSLQRALAAHGIASTLDAVLDLKETLFGKCLFGLMMLDEETFQILNPEGKLSGSDAKLILGVFENPLTGLSRAEFMSADAQTRAYFGELDQAIPNFLKSVSTNFDNRRPQAVVSAFSKALSTRKAIKWSQLLDMLLSHGLEQGDMAEPEMRELFAAHHAVMGLVNTIADDDGLIDSKTFIDSLNSLSVMMTSSSNQNEVLIVDANRLRSRKAKAVILAGLVNEGSKNSSELGIGHELVSVLARKEDIDPEVIIPPLSEQESLFVHDLIHAAEEKLHLICQIMDEQGRARAPLPFMESILMSINPKYSAEGELTRESFYLPLIEAGVNFYDAYNKIATLSECSFSKTPDSINIFNNQNIPSLPTRGDFSLKLNFKNGEKGSAFKDVEFSASSLETYVLCPYRWFLSRYLSTRSVDAELGPLETGTLVHEVLKFFYKKWTEEKKQQRVTKDNLEKAHKCLDIVMDEVFAKHPAYKLQNKDIEAGNFFRKVASLARNRIEFDASFLMPENGEGDEGVSNDFVPTGFEVGLGDGARKYQDSEPLMAHVSDVAITGSIDRIDTNASGQFVIIDYKGAIAGYAKKPDEWYEKGLLQSAIYGIAYENGTKMQGVGCIYASYLPKAEYGWLLDRDVLNPTQVNGTKKNNLPNKTYRESVQQIANLVSLSAHGMYEGKIPIAHKESVNGFELKDTEKKCSYCPNIHCPTRTREGED